MTMLNDNWTLVSSALSLVLVFIVCRFIQWFRSYRDWIAKYEKLPHDETHWFWGNFHQHPGPGQDGVDYQIRKCKERPFFASVWFGKIRCVIICNHFELARKLLQSSAFQAPKPRGPGSVYEIGLRWLGEGLLIANGPKWARNRKLLTPAFHFIALKPYLKVANECTDILIKKISKFAENRSSFELYQNINLCSLDVITRCAFSFETHCQEHGKSHPYVLAVHRLSELWMRRSLNPLIALDWIYFNFTSEGREFNKLCRIVHNMSEEIIKKRKQELELTDKEAEDMEDCDDLAVKKSHDFLDIILTSRDEDGKGLNDLEIRNEVDTFLFEGHDTTTSAMSFILLSLAENPVIQEKCREEINDVLTGRNSDEILWEDLPKFQFLTQCIKEGLRVHSPVFFIARQINEEFSYNNYVFPAGSHIAIDINNMNHNELIWGKDHMMFKPERFSPENVGRMDPFAFVPFSAGQRNCIGQNFAMNEIKVVVARIIHKFRLTIKPGHVVKKRMGVVMRTEDGIWVNAEPV